MNDHPVRWIAPQPLWGRFAADGATPGSAAALDADDQFRPALLRFATDDFMPQLFAMLAKDPSRLAGTLARPETWRTPATDGANLVDVSQVPRPAKALQRLRAARASRSPVAPIDGAATDARDTRLGLPAPRSLPLKLYQPVHQRHYLVAAGLVCGVAGMPERALATGGREQVGFVLRRLMPAANGAVEECAYVTDPAGPRWQRTGTIGDGSDAALVDGEQQLPLFPVTFADDTGHVRRLLAGTIPVGRRDEYMGSRVVTRPVADGAPAPLANSVAARKEQFKLEVAEPWKVLVRNAMKAQSTAFAGKDSATLPQKIATRRSVNLQMQMQSWLVLLDFADYLFTHLPDVWAALLAATDGSRPVADPNGDTLYQWLCHATMTPALKLALQGWLPGDAIASSLGAALVAVRDRDVATTTRTRLEAASTAFTASADGVASWPAFQFLLAGLDATDAASGPYVSLVRPAASTTATIDGGFDAREDEDASGGVPTTDAAKAQAAADLVDGLVKMIVVALPPSAELDGKAPPIPYAAKLQRDAIATNAPNDPGLFVIRCVFERCDCGPLHRALLSRPSQRFQLAGFFDPDAPARQIRISLPIDTTPAGLRKFSRNTAFQISDVLCGQVTRAKSMGLGDLVMSVLPWPFHKDLGADVGDMAPCKTGDGINIGMICSLSIPIITICAFILLMMIVLILDLIFRWIPYFIVCFPLPRFKAKGDGP